ncbi:Os03g0575801 [Oryza sativa Japonica Group]|uniref:Os03g0575801 protein n=1 Tax=Oryza sativa subsp. japonica TaxID=39947 RepID=A0A0P0VZK7_ORYSJ|nr:Os03g0575801 [Oryza sativa Japonica Group]
MDGDGWRRRQIGMMSSDDGGRRRQIRAVARQACRCPAAMPSLPRRCWWPKAANTAEEARADRTGVRLSPYSTATWLSPTWWPRRRRTESPVAAPSPDTSRLQVLQDPPWIWLK